MNFIVDTKVAPAGTICHLYVVGLTEDAWKVYPSVLRPGSSHYVTTGPWGKDTADAHRLLRKQIEKEVKKWSAHTDPRPSQLRRLDILKAALAGI